MQSWDVVNEAINDGGDSETAKTENLRNSNWLQTLGPEFLTLAFKFAREADPDAVLYYNDYNIESGPKHASSMVLLKRLLAEGAPIDAVGIQGHWRSGRVPFDDIEKAITDYASLGLKVSITELDVTIRGESGGQFGRRRFRSSAPPSVEDLNAQAEDYAKLFAIFKKHEDVIERITFWGLNDRRTWRWGQHPLLFDANNNPKPAYASIVELTGGKDAENAPEPPKKVKIEDGGQGPYSAIATESPTLAGMTIYRPDDLFLPVHNQFGVSPRILRAFSDWSGCCDAIPVSFDWSCDESIADTIIRIRKPPCAWALLDQLRQRQLPPSCGRAKFDRLPKQLGGFHFPALKPRRLLLTPANPVVGDNANLTISSAQSQCMISVTAARVPTMKNTK